jgi:hypothetical protein
MSVVVYTTWVSTLYVCCLHSLCVCTVHLSLRPYFVYTANHSIREQCVFVYRAFDFTGNVYTVKLTWICVCT